MGTRPGLALGDVGGNRKTTFEEPIILVFIYLPIFVFLFLFIIIYLDFLLFYLVFYIIEVAALAEAAASRPRRVVPDAMVGSETTTTTTTTRFMVIPAHVDEFGDEVATEISVSTTSTTLTTRDP